ncbi:MAG: hypothetical protein E7515_04370 [Ruminococcaceae bacterium]|nr:hypothetical protein [Oscillospiraceae bacterium]
MVNKLSLLLSHKLKNDGKIAETEIDLYSYGFFVLISQILLFLVTIIIGFILSCALESVIFFISFQSIRKFAGGYHASTETRCELLSTLSILICVVLIRLSQIYNYNAVLLFLTACSACCIFISCPLDTPEKPLSDDEFVHFRKITHIILLAISAAITLSFVFKLYFIMYPACLSLILESILLLVGKIKQSSLKRKDAREQSA